MSAMRTTCALFTFCIASFLVGCATTPANQNPIKGVWFPSDQWWRAASNTGGNLKNRDGTLVFVSADKVSNMLTVKERLTAVSNVQADLALAQTDLPMAFASQREGRRYIAVSLSWLDQLGTDADALAATMGHELAHVHLGHIGAARKEREETAKGAGQVLGTVLSIVGVPMGGTIGSYAVTGFARSFTRNEERAADDQGIKWAVAAGFDPCGRSRSMKMYQRMRSSGLVLPFLSTHPGYDERSELANDYSLKVNRRPCPD